MNRILWFLPIVLVLSFPSAWAADKYGPLAVGTESAGRTGAGGSDLVLHKEAAPGDTVWIRVHDDARCDATGDPADGGQGTGAAPGYATWCWEGGDLGGGLFDTCASASTSNPGCFTHYDIYSLLSNQWHNETFEAFDETGFPGEGGDDFTPWCGEFGDTLIWNNDWGYGPDYNHSLILNLGKSVGGGFNAAGGFTIGGVHMYDVEINYDYCYLEYATSNDVSTALWWEIDRYNGTSNADPGCTGTGGGDYGCAQYTAITNGYGPPTDNSGLDLLIRWRFASDKAWDDEDAAGGVHTDGAWRIDHISVLGQMGGTTYPAAGGFEDFEGGIPSEWSTPNLPQAQIGGFWSGGMWVNGTPVEVDWWHLELDPDYMNRGSMCDYSDNWMWTADDIAQDPQAAFEDNYHYRLVSPVLETGPNNPWTSQQWTGVIMENDEYLCIPMVVGDVTDTQARTFNRSTQRWSADWFNPDNRVIVGGCQFWRLNNAEDWSQFITADTDSIQFSWEFLDQCDYNATPPIPLPCMGQHRKATYIIDNVSIGLYDATVTQWGLGTASRFQDTFARDVEMHSAFKENWELTPADIWDSEDSLEISVSDFDALVLGGVGIHWRTSTDCGQTWDKEPARPLGSKDLPAVPWNTKNLNPSATDGFNNGTYRTILSRADAGVGPLWPEGTVVEYFFVAEDSNGVLDTFPNRLSLSRTSPDLVNPTIGYDRRLDWPFHVWVLPCSTSTRPLPPGQHRTVLLASGHPGTYYDIESDADLDFGDLVDFPYVIQPYQESLDRLGLVYDVYRDNAARVSRGSATGIYSQPTDRDNYGGVIDHNANQRRYDAVIWFHGTFNTLSILDSSQLEMTDYIDESGAAFLDSGFLVLVGTDLCEDRGLSDPAWVNGNSQQTTNAAYFWQNILGLEAEAGLCDQVTTQKVPFVGQPGEILSDITQAVFVQGYCDVTYDFPKRGKVLTSNSSEADNQQEKGGPFPSLASLWDTLAVALDGVGGSQQKPVASINRFTTGSTVATFTAALERFSHSQERDCILQALLNEFAVGIPTPPPSEACIIDIGVGGSPPPVPALLLGPARPNPFNPEVVIPFSLPSSGRVSLAVHDVRGRQVRTLIRKKMESGHYRGDDAVRWNGKDDQGRDVASGVYFLRLQDARDSRVAKVVLLR